MTYLDECEQIPYLGRTEMLRETEELLSEYWNGVFPVDIEAICDQLGISIIPVRNLSRVFRIDAYISADFKSIYVDQYEYENESSRYRFSLAHELGHYILHRDYYPSRINDYNEWHAFTNGFSVNYVEYQANFFAGNLLAPEDELIDFLNRRYDGSFARNCWTRGHEEFDDTLRGLKKFFMVSDQVIAYRMRDTIFGSRRLNEVAVKLHN